VAKVYEVELDAVRTVCMERLVIDRGENAVVFFHTSNIYTAGRFSPWNQFTEKTATPHGVEYCRGHIVSPCSLYIGAGQISCMMILDTEFTQEDVDGWIIDSFNGIKIKLDRAGNTFLAFNGKYVVDASFIFRGGGLSMVRFLIRLSFDKKIAEASGASRVDLALVGGINDKNPKPITSKDVVGCLKAGFENRFEPLIPESYDDAVLESHVPTYSDPLWIEGGSLG